MGLTLERLKRRKLVQWSLAYLAGAWLVVQAVDMLAEPWGWSLSVVRALQFLLAVGFFAVAVIAWFHGERGSQEVTALEIFVLGALSIVAVVGAIAVGGPHEADPDAGELGLAFPIERDRPTIAVLPLLSISPGGEEAYFAEGIHQELISRLTTLSSLIVIGRTSVMRFADCQTGIRQIGSQLRADYVLEGSVRRTGDRVRITAQLSDARSEETVWAETYDVEHTLENLFDIQIDVSERIASALELEVTSADRLGIENRPTHSLPAYESYLLGRVAWAQRTPEALEAAISHLVRATELDPTFALAYSALAEAYVLQPFFSADFATVEALARTEATANRALALDPSLGAAHTALGLVEEFRYDWKESETQFLLSLAKTPDYPTAHHWYANMLSRRGRHDEGLSHIRTAYELDPLSLIINQDVGFNLQLAGRSDAAPPPVRADPGARTRLPQHDARVLVGADRWTSLR